MRTLKGDDNHAGIDGHADDEPGETTGDASPHAEGEAHEDDHEH